MAVAADSHCDFLILEYTVARCTRQRTNDSSDELCLFFCRVYYTTKKGTCQELSRNCTSKTPRGLFIGAFRYIVLFVKLNYGDRFDRRQGFTRAAHRAIRTPDARIKTAIGAQRLQLIN